MRVDFALDQVPTGGNAYVFAIARVASSATMYQARVQIAATGAMTISVRKRIANAETQLAFLATGLVYAANTTYTLRFAVQGNQLSAKVWLTSGTEPAAYQVTASDPDLTAPDDLGIRTLTDAGLTNVPPIVFSFDNLAVSP